ncbi:MAG: VWA domain-containing protein [Boseongicola sp.]|nr:VWA domain-containing protein [Boseongicola sp.]
MTTDDHSAAQDAVLVASLLAIDPAHLGGVWIKARHGARRDWLQSVFSHLPMSSVRVTSGTSQQALFGGVDLTDSLTHGRIVERKGLLADAGAIWLNGAERLDRDLVARIVLHCEAGPGQLLLVADEGTEDDPLPAEMLRERVAFFLFEDALNINGVAPVLDAERIGRAQFSLHEIGTEASLIEAIVALADRLGVMSFRATQMAVYCARAHAAFRGVGAVGPEDIEAAVRLVFAHRMTISAEELAQENAQPAVERDVSEDQSSRPLEESDLQEVNLDAAATQLPDGLLAGLALRSKFASGKGQGASKTSLERGRPLPSRSGHLGGRGRLDLLATLQAAAPWQKLRPSPGNGALALRQEDFRIRRFKDRSERLLIFLVDASGSAAMARLAEAKGAVELMLAQAYEHRDSVCLGLFRDTSAEIVLPPTRSLTRAKKCLSSLPAGGATPLAHGLRIGLELADAARRQGQMPTIILMTDGRANRALDGTTNRAQAMSDATVLAAQIRRSAVPTVVLDTGRRTTSHVRDLAAALDADVVALPSLRSQLARPEPV